jgi:hypothetical protein
MSLQTERKEVVMIVGSVIFGIGVLIGLLAPGAVADLRSLIEKA